MAGPEFFQEPIPIRNLSIKQIQILGQSIGMTLGCTAEMKPLIAPPRAESGVELAEPKLPSRDFFLGNPGIWNGLTSLFRSLVSPERCLPIRDWPWVYRPLPFSANQLLGGGRVHRWGRARREIWRRRRVQLRGRKARRDLTLAFGDSHGVPYSISFHLMESLPFRRR